jgi:hypothetical protein
MSEQTTQLGETAALGKAIFRQRIQPLLGPGEEGRFVVIDVDSGDFEIDDSDLEATLRLKQRRPPGRFFGLRIGHRTGYQIGLQSVAGTP